MKSVIKVYLIRQMPPLLPGTVGPTTIQVGLKPGNSPAEILPRFSLPLRPGKPIPTSPLRPGSKPGERPIGPPASAPLRPGKPVPVQTPRLPGGNPTPKR